jgi:hypothetical protein
MRKKRIISIIIIIALLVPIMGTAIYSVNIKDKKVVNKEYEIDIDKAQSISNETGVKIDKIIEWFNSTRDWGQVINLASKNNNLGQDLSITTKYEDLETEYPEEKIQQAKELYDMMIFKIDEIISMKNDELYNDLKQKLDEKQALYWSLKLEKGLGSMDKALDEYLVSVQYDLDLNKLLTDKAEYEKNKLDKELLYKNELITLEKIERLSLELLSNINNSDKQEEIEDNNSVNNNEIEIPSIDTKVTIDNKKPINPLDELNKEIENINPNIE